MQGMSEQTSPLFSLVDDGFTAVLLQGIQLGIYKQLDDKCIAIRHSLNGKSFRVFETVDDAIHWLISHIH